MSSQSPKTCAVCSPNSGDDLTGAGAPSKSTGKAGMRKVHAVILASEERNSSWTRIFLCLSTY